MTAISMALSVEEDELTADPPMNIAVDCEREHLQNRIAVHSAQICTVFTRLLGKFAASCLLSRERRKRLDLVPRFIRMPIYPDADRTTKPRSYRSGAPTVNRRLRPI
jgi:hypothetical protein